ncbi:hypothetical protein HYT26_04570 [Candidatus Pacearchaeota archaeon]|nr:hypothetical protein [Candidatus Pacearchaeota archaeon]
MTSQEDRQSIIERIKSNIGEIKGTLQEYVRQGELEENKLEKIKSDLDRYECIIKYYEENPHRLNSKKNRSYLFGLGSVVKEICQYTRPLSNTPDIVEIASGLIKRSELIHFSIKNE